MTTERQRQTLDAALVSSLVAEVRGLAEPPLPEADLVSDVGCTSFDMMAICARLEDLSGRPLDYAGLRDVRTVEDLSRLVTV